MATPQTIQSGAAATARGGAGFFQLLLTFIVGGLFFSTAIAALTAFLAIGKENIVRVWNIGRIVVRRVWNIFCLGLGEARATLLGGKKRNWREFWRVLREQLTLTRQAVVDGVQAIRLEANLYSAVIGQPGLLVLQYFIDNLTPKFISATAEKSFEDALKDVKNPNIRKLRLAEFSFGDKVPQLEAARAYNLEGDAMAFDIDMKWDSDLLATLKLTGSRLGVTVPVTVKNVSFEGVVRFVLTPLTPDPPGFGAALVSFPTAPKIGMDVRMAGGEITRMPWLRTEIMNAMQKGIADEFLWPKRVVIPSPAATIGTPKPMLTRLELEELSYSDPLIRAERLLSQELVYQNANLKREVPDEKSLQMDVLVRDENEEEEEDISNSDLTEGKGALGNKAHTWKRQGYRLPWKRMPLHSLNELRHRDDSKVERANSTSLEHVPKS